MAVASGGIEGQEWGSPFRRKPNITPPAMSDFTYIRAQSRPRFPESRLGIIDHAYPEEKDEASAFGESRSGP